jgi:hypothetical protein
MSNKDGNVDDDISLGHQQPNPEDSALFRPQGLRWLHRYTIRKHFH